VVGTGTWESVVPEETWRAVHALLADPLRDTNRGRQAYRTLLGGLARCVCGAPVYGGKSSHGHQIYRCDDLSGGGGGHVARRAAPIDDYVSDLVVKRLSRSDAADLLVDPHRPDTNALRAEANALRARLESVGLEFAEGELTTSQLRVINDRIGTKLRGIEDQMAEAGRLSVLGPLVHADDVRAAWDRLDLDRRRAVIDILLAITLDSPGRGARVFDPDTVRVTWKLDS
jgi:hypothetical protein